MGVSKWWATAALVLFVGVGAIGCGGGSDDEADPNVRPCASSEEGCTNDPVDLGDANLDLPADWPGDLAAPEGARVLSAYTSEDPQAMNVVFGLDGEVPAVLESVRDGLVTAGFVVDPSAPATIDGFSAVVATGDEFRVTAQVFEAPAAESEDTGSVQVSYTLNRA